MNLCFTVPAMVSCIIWDDVKMSHSAEDEISLLPSSSSSQTGCLNGFCFGMTLVPSDFCTEKKTNLFTAAACSSCVWNLQTEINRTISMLLSSPHYLHTLIKFKPFSDTVIEQVIVLECCSANDKCHCAIAMNIWRNILNCFGSQLSLFKVIFVLHMGWKMFL